MYVFAECRTQSQEKKHTYRIFQVSMMNIHIGKMMIDLTLRNPRNPKNPKIFKPE